MINQLRKLLLITFLSFFLYQVSAQVIITNNDMPSPGDTIRKSTSVATPGIDYTLTGENYSWDFTTLFPIVQTVDTFVSVSSVPFLYQFVFIPNVVANLAQAYDFPDTLGIPVIDPYRFYKNSSSSFNDVGFAVTVSNIPIPLKFDSPDVIYKFPLEYGNDADSSYSGVDFGIPDIGFISIERKRVNQVDGWGTLTTPYGEFEVLRMKSLVEETDSIYIDSISFGTAIERAYTEYKWMANGFGQPLLQVTEEGAIVTVAWIDSIFDPSTSIAESQVAQSGFILYPNPMINEGNLQLTIPENRNVELMVYSASGMAVNLLYKGKLEKGVHSFALSKQALNLKNGVYFISLKTDNDILTQKLIVN